MTFLRRLLLLAMGLLAGCTDASQYTLRVGTNLWPGYEPLYLARSLGYYDKQGIQLIEYRSATQVIQSFHDELIDVAALTMDEALLLICDKNVDLAAFLITNISAGADVIIAQPDIDHFQDLKGKTIGVEGTALGAYLLSRALEVNRMTLMDIEVKNFEAYEHERAFLDKQVDAVVTFDPTSTILLNIGGNLLFDSGQIPNEIIDVLVIRKSLLSQKKRALKSLTTGWFKALSVMENDPHVAAASIAKRLQISPTEVLSSYNTIKLPNLAENQAILRGGSNGTLQKQAKRLSDSMIKHRLLKNNLCESNIAYARLLEHSAP